jgi:stearoyl-CoA desaturase (delta-9 desaturase)
LGEDRPDIMGGALCARIGISLFIRQEHPELGPSVLVCLGAVRLVWVWHVTWAVNSVYRNYETCDFSRNNSIIGVVVSGEGWHNNHHADPNSAQHGHAWWEFDAAWLAIRLLAVVGLAWDVKRPSPHLQRLRLRGHGNF